MTKQERQVATTRATCTEVARELFQENPTDMRAHALQIRQATSWPAQDSQAELRLAQVQGTSVAHLPSPAAENAFPMKTNKFTETWQMQFPGAEAIFSIKERFKFLITLTIALRLGPSPSLRSRCRCRCPSRCGNGGSGRRPGRSPGWRHETPPDIHQKHE